jgi:regulator of RNase E activity RraA
MTMHVRSAALSDALDDAAARSAASVADPLTYRGAVTPFSGPAYTLEFEPSEAIEDDPYAAIIDAIDGLPAGVVVVIATNGFHETAYWGELFSAAALGRGAAGVVCDGPTRDTTAIQSLGLPVVSRGARPHDFKGRAKLTGVGNPVTCGGLYISAGDLIVVDADGIVVAPRQIASAVVTAASAKTATERNVLEHLLAGATLRAVWDRWGVL